MSFNDRKIPLSVDAHFLSYLHDNYLKDKNSVDKSWQEYFSDIPEKSKEDIVFKKPSIELLEKGKQAPEKSFALPDINFISIQEKLRSLLLNIKTYGHLSAKLDSLNIMPRKQFNELFNIEKYNLKESDLDLIIDTSTIGHDFGKMTIKEYIEQLKNIYSNNIGFEYITLPEEEKAWMDEQIISLYQQELSPDEKESIFHLLLKNEEMEKFMDKRFKGVTRFSLEGLDSILVALESLIKAYDFHTKNILTRNIIIACTHRGRLSILSNILDKKEEDLFASFISDSFSDDLECIGDVKYHNGYNNTKQSSFGGSDVNLSVLNNPSHLEAVYPVAVGYTKGLHSKDSNNCCVVLHGDDAISGQGVVYEVINMSGIEGYNIDGTIHIIANNQIGFTAEYFEERTSVYCTDIAKTINVPVIHVNADDPEMCFKAAEIAVKYKMRFKKDIFIDVIGYRRRGHNEGDNPNVFAPLIYDKIPDHPTVVSLYKEKILDENIINQSKINELTLKYNTTINKAFNIASSGNYKISQCSIINKISNVGKDINSSYEIDKIKNVWKNILELPNDFTLNNSLNRRFKMINDLLSKSKLDWPMAESTAFYHILSKGINIRFTGQDSQRGTFSQRNLVLVDEKNGNRLNILDNLFSDANFDIHNSPLSEYGALGFEYGYALSAQKSLTIWEGQYGDFVNGAQIIIDQYISSAESKWGQSNGLMVFLPHGYDGQGPDHSSGDLERFLQLTNGNNIIVVNCSSAANFYHFIVRQALSLVKKPCIILTPKSMLRNASLASDFKDFSVDTFKPILQNNDFDYNAERLVICSGKIYHELLEYKKNINDKKIAIISLEEVHPFPTEKLKKIINKMSKVKSFIWLQEEPANKGALFFVKDHIVNVILDTKLNIKNVLETHLKQIQNLSNSYIKVNCSMDGLLLSVSRNISDSSATGFGNRHAMEQKLLKEAIFKII